VRAQATLLFRLTPNSLVELEKAEVELIVTELVRETEPAKTGGAAAKEKKDDEKKEEKVEENKDEAKKHEQQKDEKKQQQQDEAKKADEKKQDEEKQEGEEAKAEERLVERKRTVRVPLTVTRLPVPGLLSPTRRAQAEQRYPSPRPCRLRELRR
jgi:hypothetical protein